VTGEPEFVREPSTIEFGGPSRPRRHDGLLPVLIALAAGLALGFLIGRNHAAADSPPASASASPPAAATTAEPDPIAATGRTCAVTLPGPGGHDDLQLGAEIRNRGTRPVTLETPGVQLPLGGLTIAEPPTLTACGELPGITETVLAAGEGSWLSVRLHVPGGACPAAQPVLFVISYQAGPGDHDQANVGGFNDLGKVRYPGCPS
jgi:hypothetical protein